MLNASTDKYRLSSIEGIWSCSGLTVGDGPVLVGIAAGDYSLAEIEQCLEAATAIDLGDEIAREQANRKVRVIGLCSHQEPLINGGQMLKTRLNWLVAIGNQPQIFAYNTSAGSLTTGAAHKFSGWANLIF